MLRVSLIWESILKRHYQLSIMHLIPDNHLFLFYVYLMQTLVVFFILLSTYTAICIKLCTLKNIRSILAAIDDGDHQHV